MAKKSRLLMATRKAPGPRTAALSLSLPTGNFALKFLFVCFSPAPDEGAGFFH
jgi:hypothetical protein